MAEFDDENLPDYDDVNLMISTDSLMEVAKQKLKETKGHDEGVIDRMMNIYDDRDLVLKALDAAKDQGAPNNIDIAVNWIISNPEEFEKATRKKEANTNTNTIESDEEETERVIHPMEVEAATINGGDTRATTTNDNAGESTSGHEGGGGGGGGVGDIECKEKCMECLECTRICCNNCCEASYEKYDGMNSDQKKVFWGGIGCFCCIGMLLLVILLPVSIRKVDYDEYAIRYNDLTNEADSEEYGEGRYIFTPQTTLFVYDSLIQKLSLELECLTRDGILMEIDVDIQYAIPKASVYDIWDEFGKEKQIDTYLALVAADSIRDSVGSFDASAFYRNRYGIQTKIENALSLDMDEANTHLLFVSAVLAGYGYPEQLSEKIKQKRVTENDIEVAQNERDGALTDAQTELLVARIYADRLSIQGQAEVESILNEAEAKAKAITARFELIESLFLSTQNQTGFSGKQFVDYWLTSFVLLNADNPITTTFVNDTINFDYSDNDYTSTTTPSPTVFTNDTNDTLFTPFMTTDLPDTTFAYFTSTTE